MDRSEEAINGCLQFNDGSEHAPLESPAGEPGDASDRKTNPYIGLAPDDFRRVRSTRSRAAAWNVSLETVQGQVWAGIAISVQALQTRAGDLPECESDPDQAVKPMVWRITTRRSTRRCSNGRRH